MFGITLHFNNRNNGYYRISLVEFMALWRTLHEVQQLKQELLLDRTCTTPALRNVVDNLNPMNQQTTGG